MKTHRTQRLLCLNKSDTQSNVRKEIGQRLLFRPFAQIPSASQRLCGEKISLA